MQKVAPILSKLSIIGTIACLANCLLVPLFPLVSYALLVLGEPTTEEEIEAWHDRMHNKLIIFILITGLSTTFYNFAKRHGSVLSLICSLSGMSILVVQVVYPSLFKEIFGLCNCCYGHYYTGISAILMLTGTYLGYRSEKCCAISKNEQKKNNRKNRKNNFEHTQSATKAYKCE
jgi:hypothetical protein